MNLYRSCFKPCTTSYLHKLHLLAPRLGPLGVVAQIHREPQLQLELSHW